LQAPALIYASQKPLQKAEEGHDFPEILPLIGCIPSYACPLQVQPAIGAFFGHIKEDFKS
jgi:hypothetical protein